MKGLELSQRYFNEHGLPMLLRRFPEHEGRIACGLAGDGSECYGFDDEISRDHDWGPCFCLWVGSDDFREIGQALMAEYERLPDTFEGFGPRLQSAWGGGRVGVIETPSFYKRFTGYDHVPANNEEWFLIPEQALAAATNGNVFRDPSGEFTSWRMRLLEFYPEDVRLKKIAARCMGIAQSGQYNLARCMRRWDRFSAMYSEAKFCAEVISLVFLLNRHYTPYYKWMNRALTSLPRLGEIIHARLQSLFQTIDTPTKIDIVEDICRLIIEELRVEGLSESSSSFLLDHGPGIQARISDHRLRERDIWIG